MTTYQTRETSVHDGKPVECYEFVGSYTTYRYTSADLPYVVNGHTFTPLALKRSSLKVGVYDEDNNKLQIELPLTSALVRDYGFQITPPRLQLILYRIHDGTNPSSDFAVIWQGFVTVFATNNNVVTVDVPSIFSSAMSGSVPSVYYQGPCNHVLFDSTGCKVSRIANMVETTVMSVVEDSVQIASNGGFPDGAFIGGECADLAHNDRRTIVAHASNLLTVNYPFSKLTAGATIQVTRGCDHAYNGHCKTVFDNQINFGGFPYIPNVNLFESGI